MSIAMISSEVTQASEPTSSDPGEPFILLYRQHIPSYCVRHQLLYQNLALMCSNTPCFKRRS